MAAVTSRCICISSINGDRTQNQLCVAQNASKSNTQGTVSGMPFVTINLPSTGAGLRDSKVCSRTSDTLCEPLDGYYCTVPVKDGCKGAVELTKCSPGQYIKQPG